MKQILLIMAVLGLTQDLFAQDITNAKLEWKVDGLVDNKTNGQFSYSCVFKTFNDHVDWNQGGGFDSRIDIVSVSGSWLDISKDGSITFSVLYDGENGQMMISRTNSKYRIQLKLGPAGAPTLNQEFVVSSVTPIP